MAKKPARKAPARKPGRPRVHDRAATMRAICERIATGELVKHAAAALGVDERTVREWGVSEEFAPLYARAREAQAHALAERTIEISDGVDPQTVASLEALDRMEAAAEELEGKERAAEFALLASLRTNVVKRDALRVDTRKWYTAKVAPKLYGEKVAHELTGKDGGPVETRQSIVFGEREIVF